MSDAPFTPEMRRALDSFTPPPLPEGFADRVAARAQQRETSPAAPLPRLSRRWRSANPWRRGGWFLGAAAGLGLMSATAAATGMFGEPLQVPVISRIAQSLDIVPAPTASRPAQRAPALAEAGAAPADPVPVRERLDALLDDPDFRALPRPERRAELRRTARELVDSGAATPREVVTALRETTRERIARMPPERREQIVEAVVQRRAERREAIAEMPPEERQARRQILRERLSELRERRAGRLEQEAIDAPVPAEPRAHAPAEDSVPPREGSDAVAR
jgi:hypothetical protein